jgi:AraC-like DNA-binding protein
VQKRLKEKCRLTSASVPLKPDFPIGLGVPTFYEQDDQPISFLHVHDCLEIGYWAAGSGIFVVEEKIMSYRAGDVVVTAPGDFHFCQSKPGTVSSGAWVFLDPARLIPASLAESRFLSTATLSGADFRNVLPAGKHPEIAGLVKALIAELRDQPDGYRSAVRGLVLLLLVRLQRLVPGAPRIQGTRRAAQRRRLAVEQIAPALEIMARDRARPIGIGELAGACYFSPTHFRRLFRAALSKSPLEYLTQLRIQQAAGLLEGTEQGISEIAREAGFLTLSSFNRHFKRITGASPRQWRENNS